MPLVVAVWPNNTISVIRMWMGFSMLDLFNEIDAEANPHDAKCYLVRSDEDGMYITFGWKCLDDGTSVEPKSPAVGIGTLYGKCKRLRWPDDIVKQWGRELRKNARQQHARHGAEFLSADEIPKLPAPPPPVHTVDQIRSMKSFSGVYLAYDDDGKCHYVGESASVNKRVSKSRSEIGCRMLGVVECKPHERKRIEAYFIALLDPPGNACSTHRMSAEREATKNNKQESTDGRAQG